MEKADPGFRSAEKLSRYATHLKPLKEPYSIDERVRHAVRSAADLARHWRRS